MTTFTRKTSDVPGSPGRLHYYHTHPSGLCHLAVWRPSASFQDAPVALLVHGGGLGNAPGWGSMTTESAIASGKAANLVQALYDEGYAIVSIDYPVTGYFKHQSLPDGLAGRARILGSWEEIWPLALWPEQPSYVALAIQYVKSNWCGISGPDISLFGEELWGDGNSIDPNRVVCIGDDWGSTLLMYACLQPTGFYPFERRLAHESMDPFVPRASHRPRALVLRNPGPIDFSQFYVDIGYTFSTVPEYLHGDRFHPMMRAESQRRWGGRDYSGDPEPTDGLRSGTAMRAPIKDAWKRQSPWWILAENHAENANLPMHIEMAGTGYGVYDASLSATDWDPGTMLDDHAGYKAFIQPHDGRLQGSPLRSALTSYGTSASAIRQSVVLDTATSTSYPVLSSGAYAAAVLAWLETVGV